MRILLVLLYLLSFYVLTSPGVTRRREGSNIAVCLEGQTKQICTLVGGEPHRVLDRKKLRPNVFLITDVTDVNIGDCEKIFFLPEAINSIERHDALIDYAFNKTKARNATILLYFSYWPQGHVLLLFSKLYEFPDRARYAAAARFFASSLLSGVLSFIGVA
jgi:hypothetical protein